MEASNTQPKPTTLAEMAARRKTLAEMASSSQARRTSRFDRGSLLTFQDPSERKTVDRRSFLGKAAVVAVVGAASIYGLSKVDPAKALETFAGTPTPKPKEPPKGLTVTATRIPDASPTATVPPSKPTEVPTTATSSPTETQPPTETAAASPTPKPTEAPPTATASPTAKPTEAPSPTASPSTASETEKTKRNFIKDVLIPPLTQIVDKIRSEKTKTDPEYQKRIDRDLNKGRINVIIIGSGSEELSYQEEDADAILVASYDSNKNKATLISLHREAQAPEIYQEAQKRGQPVKTYETEVMRALRVGGFGLLEKIVEDTTGLSSDLYAKFTLDSLIIIVDKVLGKVKIDVPEAIKKDAYGVSFEKGLQEMNGKRIMEYATTRTSSSVERRNSAQQQVLEAIMDTFLERFTSNNIVTNIMLLSNLKSVLDELQSKNKLKTNIPVSDMLNGIITQLPSLVSGLSEGKSFFSKPGITRFGVVEGTDLKRYDPKTTGPRGALMAYTDEKGQQIGVNLDDPKSLAPEALIGRYYKRIRETIKSKLL